MNHLLLEYLIRQILSEEEFTNLNVRSFVDRDTRTNKFVDALKAGTPLTLAKGDDKVTVKSVEVIKNGKSTIYDPKTQADELKAVLPTLASRDKLYLYDDTNVDNGKDKPTGRRYSITAVAKTTELGGKGKGGTLGPERAAIADLEKQFAQIGKPITVILNDIRYPDVTGVVNVKENQKADFALVNSKGVPVIFISYKPGNSAKDVISYGGITAISAKSKDVQRFIEAVKENTNDLKGLGYEFGAPLKDKGAALRAIYGSDFSTKKYGLNSVQALMQGDVRLTPSKDAYNLTSSHTILSPTIPDGSYEPYLNARFAGDRNQFGIQHCRIGIVPKDARTNIKSPFINKQDNDKAI